MIGGKGASKNKTAWFGIPRGDIPLNEIHEIPYGLKLEYQRIGTRWYSQAPEAVGNNVPFFADMDVEKMDAAARMSITTQMSITMNDDAISAHPFLT